MDIFGIGLAKKYRNLDDGVFESLELVKTIYHQQETTKQKTNN